MYVYSDRRNSRMCKNCVKQEYPDRDTMCLESGSYFLNYKGCAHCQQKDNLDTANKCTRNPSQDEEQEVIVYDHICKNCNHVVANHEHRFRIEEDFQIYEMYCMLCGTAEDTRSILPNDPRQQPMFC